MGLAMIKQGCPNRYRPSELADVLESAATNLEEHGWTRIWSGNPDDGWDVIEALMQTARVSTQANRATAALKAQIDRDYGCRALTRWNHRQRDRRKVVRLMRRTARNLRNHDLRRVSDYSFTFDN